MKRILEFDTENKYVKERPEGDNYVLKENEYEAGLDEDIIFYSPALVNGQVVEGLTQAEIDTLTGNTLEAKKAEKIAELDKQCTETILGRFNATLNAVDYQFSYDAEAQSRFNGVGLLFVSGKLTSIEWTAYVNGERTRITLTSQDFDIVSLAALQHQNTNIVRYNQLLSEVNNATNIAEVDAVVW